MAVISEETPLSEQDKGPLVYQESKVFHGETFLCNVYDNTKSRHVTFEIYGLDTQDVLLLGYSYESFDKEFRFNAELMNPNRKEGRFHWVIERLAVVTVGKERRLERKPEPSEEVPEVPVYETTRKIPTGRMDLKERQRLREQMDMLDIKRAENIAKKRAATKERFLKHLFRIKEEDARKKQEVEDKISVERQQRLRSREEQLRLEEEEQQRLQAQAKLRRKAVEVKEQRTEEQDEEDYRLLRERWRVLDAEKAKNIREAHEKKEAELAARRQAELDEQHALEDAQARREAAWQQRDARVARKQAALLNEILEVKAEMQRQERMRKERTQEFIKVLHSERQPIFKAQLERTEERALAQEQEREAVSTYVEKRALPPKVKYKGLNAVAKAPPPAQPVSPKAKAKGRAKRDKKEDEKVEPQETEKSRTDRVLDAVEAKVRADMAEEQRRQRLHGQREAKAEQRWQAHCEAEAKRMRDYREAHRQRELAAEQQAAERQLIMRQSDAERKEAAERKRQELERLQRVREHNLARREEQRLAALCA